MRQLTAKQKKVLKVYAQKANSIPFSVEDLPDEIWDALQKINDTEILYQEVNRFLNDIYWDIEKSRNPFPFPR